MRMWLDTEFNGFGGELMSIALVPESGPEFYAVLRLPETIDPWVQEHVVPILHGTQMDKPDVRLAMQEYLMQWDAIHVIADWPADIAHFCELLLTDVPGERINTPPLSMEIVRFDAPSELPHNALADARGMRAFFFANVRE